VAFRTRGLGGCAQAHPSGVAPEALEEWIYSSRGFSYVVRGVYRVCRAHDASSGRWAPVWLQEEPPSLYAEQEGDQEFPCLFCTALAHPFRSEGGVFLLSPRVRVRVAGSRLGCRKSPRASAQSKRAIRSFPVFFVWPSRILFVQKEGWSMPGYPRWASSDTSGELLTGKSKWRPVPHSIGVG